MTAPESLAIIEALQEAPFDYPEVARNVEATLRDLRRWGDLATALRYISPQQTRQILIVFLKSKNEAVQEWRYNILQALLNNRPDILENMRTMTETDWMMQWFYQYYSIPEDLRHFGPPK